MCRGVRIQLQELSPTCLSSLSTAPPPPFFSQHTSSFLPPNPCMIYPQPLLTFKTQFSSSLPVITSLTFPTRRGIIFGILPCVLPSTCTSRSGILVFSTHSFVSPTELGACLGKNLPHSFLSIHHNSIVSDT